MTNVHCKLLVLISKYGQMPVADEPETWIRELPLLVLVYEGITAGVFEHLPASPPQERVQGMRGHEHLPA